MPSGGARSRSGPPPDPNSLKTARRGLTFTSLPAAGYDGEVPEYPLEDGGERSVRELALWAWAWRTPQAAMWAKEPWRQHSVALWVRTAAICESGDATAADKNSLHRFADQIGLTPAGLAFNGWKITADEAPRPPVPLRPTARDRMKLLRVDAGEALDDARSRFTTVEAPRSAS